MGGFKSVKNAASFDEAEEEHQGLMASERTEPSALSRGHGSKPSASVHTRLKE